MAYQVNAIWVYVEVGFYFFDDVKDVGRIINVGLVKVAAGRGSIPESIFFGLYFLVSIRRDKQEAVGVGDSAETHIEVLDCTV
jgi:hypothetical protein